MLLLLALLGADQDPFAVCRTMEHAMPRLACFDSIDTSTACGEQGLQAEVIGCAGIVDNAKRLGCIDAVIAKMRSIGLTAAERFDRAKRLLVAKQTDVAVDELLLALQADPRHGPSLMLLGKAYAELGREPDAVASFERFLEVEPKHPDADKLRLIVEAFRSNAALGSWTVETSTDEITGKVSHSATLWAPGDVMLWVFCQSKWEPLLVIGWDQFVGVGTAPVDMRIGDQVVSPAPWSVDNRSSKSTVHPSSKGQGETRKLLDRLAAAPQMIVRVRPPRDASITATFDLTGTKAAMAALRSRCEAKP